MKKLKDIYADLASPKKESTLPDIIHWKARALAAESLKEQFLVDYTREDRCRFCGNEIWWITIGKPFDSITFRNVPLNADLSKHHNCRTKPLIHHVHENRQPSPKTNRMRGLLKNDRAYGKGENTRNAFLKNHLEKSP